ncbi:MBL fold metallo-hydrolase [Ornithinimicrobium sp. INDO-MA30-4]|uniref:MBL fold metallo-hydrolase n=1 Tax=Ornithinimicrobium sp. INDO-MA30-4 TaxID=2908651 RepID=UPI002883164D|nr:MBL fold metallo-hydrolase [Ornithinimicrobium sp. INDO-MA30-4]
MELTVIGCSGSVAGPDSPASCYLLRAEQDGRCWQIVLDLGSGALGGLQRHMDPLTLDAAVLSHLHPDHCLDLTGLHVMWTHHPVMQPSGRLPVYGPSGTAERLARAQGWIRRSRSRTPSMFVRCPVDRSSGLVPSACCPSWSITQSRHLATG